MSSSSWSYNATAVEEIANNQRFFDLNLGPFLTGISVQIFMMGCLTIQMWKYFEVFVVNPSSPGVSDVVGQFHDADPRTTKIFVVVLFLASALQCATDFELLYKAFIINYGRIVSWDHYGWTFAYEPAWTAIIAALAQAFFLQRCYTVTRSIWVASAGGLGILLSLGAGIAASVGLSQRPYYTETSIDYHASHNLADSYCCNGCWDFNHLGYALAKNEDWIQTEKVRVFYYLIIPHSYAPPHRPCPESSDSRLKLPMRPYPFFRLTLTSLVAIIDLLLYITMGKQNTIHLALQMIVGKTYNHSVMVTLLARTRIRGEFDSNSAGRMNSDSNGTKPNQNNGVTVTRTQIRITDHVEIPMKSMVHSERREEEDADADAGSAKIARMV
ncbi:hypothetical protein FB45DRAFT_1075565 [Roridomyces roridus]|uniref:Uncharacterized protein n=1 Tax=Roridomyces roridus TaxID=1738132 RepID=A0AAD7CIC6_9AGAR|nr:hypothetical protein FB45DRAFT_1075565 [Roridomyces roridus]